MLTGWLINSFRLTYNHISGSNVNCLFVQTRNYAARKGTRMRKQKILAEKVAAARKRRNAEERKKLEVKKKKTDPFKKMDENLAREPIDNVWFVKFFRKPVYSLKEAIEFHRETHHPTMYNLPNTYITATFDLDLRREKKTKVVEKCSKIIDVPHAFQLPENRSILAFCKMASEIDSAKAAGVDYVGGVDLIKQIQTGNFLYQEYQYIVAHVDILPELLLIRGLLKKKFPHKKLGNLGDDLGYLVKKFKHGIGYSLVPNNDFKEYGTIDCIFGKLNMETNHLEENFSALIRDINSLNPRKDGKFIRRVSIASSPSPELFRINFENYLSVVPETEEDDIEDAVIATQ